MIAYGSLNNSWVSEVIAEMNFGDDKDTQDDELKSKNQSIGKRNESFSCLE